MGGGLVIDSLNTFPLPRPGGLFARTIDDGGGGGRSGEVVRGGGGKVQLMRMTVIVD